MAIFNFQILRLISLEGIKYRLAKKTIKEFIAKSPSEAEEQIK